jgi:hypothetical protein
MDLKRNLPRICADDTDRTNQIRSNPLNPRSKGRSHEGSKLKHKC